MESPEPPPQIVGTAVVPYPANLAGGPLCEENANFHQVPIYIVTEPSQLPAEFVDLSPGRPVPIVGLDCEGVDLCRNGRLCIMQIALPEGIYIVDAIKGGDRIMQACKPSLESQNVIKIMHDCKRDSEALYYQFGIKLRNVFDTQVAYTIIEEQERKTRLPDAYISFVSLLADPRYCGETYPEKADVRVMLKQVPSFWTQRPLTETMIKTATDDVRFNIFIYHNMMRKLRDGAYWRTLIRGALYCRCFCLSVNNFADWPPLPTPNYRDIELAGGNVEEEILSVLEVPAGKMGLVIGRKGASIMSIKQACNVEIHMGGAKGPSDKVFIIGVEKEVRKTEAIIRGKIMDIV